MEHGLAALAASAFRASTFSHILPGYYPNDVVDVFLYFRRLLQVGPSRLERGQQDRMDGRGPLFLQRSQLEP